jgi:hypothetical protein
VLIVLHIGHENSTLTLSSIELENELLKAINFLAEGKGAINFGGPLLIESYFLISKLSTILSESLILSGFLGIVKFLGSFNLGRVNLLL